MRPIILLLAIAAALITTPAVAHAPGHTATGPDDPATWVNESAVLDATRVTSTVTERAPSPMDLARAYAAQHGLTSCGPPKDAELDDVFLTLAVHPLDLQPITDRIVPVDLDTALDSAGERIVLLACDKEQS